MPKVSSITRVLEIIEAVSYASKPISPLELSQELDIPKPTIHRLIQNLVDEGFVTVDIGGGIIPGKRVRNLGVELWQQRLFFNERQMILQKLVDDQLARGIQIEDKPVVRRAISSAPVVKPIRVNAPNSVFALGNVFSSNKS